MNRTQRISVVDGGGKNVGEADSSGDPRPEAARTAGEPGFVDPPLMDLIDLATPMVSPRGPPLPATRRSRTGDLLITNSDQGETPQHRDELSPQKTEDPD